MALLTGGAVAGLSCELAFAAGVRAEVLLVPILIASVTFMVIRRKKWQWASLGEACLLYAVALVPAVVSPFPVIGLWGGDWLLIFDAGRTLWEGGQLSIASLQRPPLFGAATSPLWLLSDGLIPFQILSAVMSAGTLGACLFAADHFWPRISRPRLLAPLVLSVFFLHNTAACWGKLAAAAFLLAAATDLLGGYPRTRTWWAGVWFALAVATHQSSVIYIPLLVAILVTQRDVTLRSALKVLVIFAICTLLLAGLYEGWTAWQHGLGTKIAANPTVAQRQPDVPFVTNTLLVVVTSFLGWAPRDYFVLWLQTGDLWSRARAGKELFWLTTSWFELQAGTFIGAFLPFLFVASRELLAHARAQLADWKGRIFLCACVLVILLNGALNPYSSANGTMQTGLVGLALAGFLFLGRWLERGHPRRWRMMVAITLAIGTLPWLAFNLALIAGVRLNENFPSVFATASEEDWQRLVSNQLSSLGLSAFPFLHLTLLFFGAACLFVGRNLANASAKASSSAPE
jgi:hypothetical protein